MLSGGININKKHILKIIPVAASIIIFAMLIFVFKDKLTGGLLTYQPSNLYIAAAAVLVIYALKSVSVVFPLLVLYAGVGRVFPVAFALILNFIGISICTAIPYYLGKAVGRQAVEDLIAKNKKAEQINNLKAKNGFYFCYILRIINILPGDIVSLLLGAGNMQAKDYFAGSLFGLLPTMIAATLAGEAILKPLSAEFLIPFAVLIIISAVSVAIYNRMFNK